MMYFKVDIIDFSGQLGAAKHAVNTTLMQQSCRYINITFTVVFLQNNKYKSIIRSQFCSDLVSTVFNR